MISTVFRSRLHSNWAAPPSLWMVRPHAFRQRVKSRGNNSRAGDMDQTLSGLIYMVWVFLSFLHPLHELRKNLVLLSIGKVITALLNNITYNGTFVKTPRWKRTKHQNWFPHCWLISTVHPTSALKLLQTSKEHNISFWQHHKFFSVEYYAILNNKFYSKIK